MEFGFYNHSMSIKEQYLYIFKIFTISFNLAEGSPDQIINKEGIGI